MGENVRCGNEPGFGWGMLATWSAGEKEWAREGFFDILNCFLKRIAEE